MRWVEPLALLGAVLALCACGQRAEPGHEAPSRGKLVAEGSLGPVSATLHMLPEEPRFGERVRFVLELVAREGAALEAPEISARLGHFRVRGQDRESSSGGLRVTITAEPEKTGTNICRLPGLRFQVESGEGAGTQQELRLAPFEVEVAGLPPGEQPDLAALGGPLAPVPIPLGRRASHVFWSLLGATLVLLVAAALWWRRHRRRRDTLAPLLDPGEEAAQALASLLAMDLIREGAFAEFYVRLTSIVRRYIERTTGIHAPEQTTEEFLREMEGSSSFQPEQRRRLQDFLSASDLVKFAAQVPSEAEIEAALQSARSFCGLLAEELAA